MFKKIALVTFIIAALTHHAGALDIYNEKNGQLSIPLVSANGTTYTDVVISIGEVVAVNGGTSNSTIDYYDPVTNRLSIPSVSAYGKIYTNVVVTVAGIISVGGGGGVSSSSTASKTGTTFSTDYVSLPNAQSLLSGLCTTASKTGGFSSKIATADMNSDGKLDIVAVYWCSYSSPGQDYNGPVPNTVLVYLSQNDGSYIIGNKQLFGLDIVDIGGYSNGFTVGDFNNDGKPDIGIGVSKEDGRAFVNNGASWVAPQIVLLSKTDGTYSVESFAIKAASGSVQAADNGVGGVDFVYPVSANAKAAAYRWVNNFWQQILDYPAVSTFTNFFSRPSVSSGASWHSPKSVDK